MSNSEERRRALIDLSRLDGNRWCADCERRNPDNICLTFGSFVCSRCAAEHVRMKRKIKNIDRDDVTSEELQRMRAIGNDRCNRKYLAKYDDREYPMPKQDDDKSVKEFMWLKYDNTWALSKEEKEQRKFGSSVSPASTYLSGGPSPHAPYLGGGGALGYPQRSPYGGASPQLGYHEPPYAQVTRRPYESPKGGYFEAAQYGAGPYDDYGAPPPDNYRGGPPGARYRGGGPPPPAPSNGRTGHPYGAPPPPERDDAHRNGGYRNDPYPSDPYRSDPYYRDGGRAHSTSLRPGEPPLPYGDPYYDHEEDRDRERGEISRGHSKSSDKSKKKKKSGKGSLRNHSDDSSEDDKEGKKLKHKKKSSKAVRRPHGSSEESFDRSDEESEKRSKHKKKKKSATAPKPSKKKVSSESESSSDSDSSDGASRKKKKKGSKKRSSKVPSGASGSATASTVNNAGAMPSPGQSQLLIPVEPAQTIPGQQLMPPQPPLGMPVGAMPMGPPGTADFGLQPYPTGAPQPLIMGGNPGLLPPGTQLPQSNLYNDFRNMGLQ